LVLHPVCLDFKLAPNKTSSKLNWFYIQYVQT